MHYTGADNAQLRLRTVLHPGCGPRREGARLPFVYLGFMMLPCTLMETDHLPSVGPDADTIIVSWRLLLRPSAARVRRGLR